MPNGVDPAQAEYGPSVPLKQPNAEALETSLTRALLRARQVLTLRRLEAAAAGKGARAARTNSKADRFKFDVAQKNARSQALEAKCSAKVSRSRCATGSS